MDVKRLDPAEAEAQGYTLNDAGFYVDANGDLAPGQVTLGMAASGGGVLTEPGTGKHYIMQGGKKKYISPVAFDPKTPTEAPSFFHHGSTFNTDTGEMENPFDWGSLLTLAAGGMLGAGALSAAGAFGGAAGALPSTTTVGGMGALPAGGAGINSAALLGAGAGAGEASVAGGTAAGLGAAGGGGGTAAGVGGGAAAGAGAGEGAAAAGGAAAGDVLPAGTMAIPGTAGIPVGAGIAPGVTEAGVPGIASGTGMSAIGGGGSVLGKVVDQLKNPSTLSQIAGAAGKGLGGAATAQGNNQLLNEGLGLEANTQNIAGRNAYIDQVSKLAQLGLSANDQNIAGQKAFLDEIAQQAALRNAAKNTDISGENAFVNQNLGMASEEDKQRNQAFHDIMKASLLRNMKASPYNPSGVQKMSPTLLATLGDLESQDSARLHKPASYDVANLDRPTKYTPVDLGNMPAPTPYTPYSVGSLPTPTPYKDYVPGKIGDSTLQDVSNWLSPTLTTVGTIADILRKTQSA